MKYTAVIGVLGIVVSAFAAYKRKALTGKGALGFLGMGGLGFTFAFVMFMPAIVFNFEKVWISLKWEYQSKVTQTEFDFEVFLEAFRLCFPLWILIPSIAGFLVCLALYRSTTLGSIALVFGVYLLLMGKALAPDYLIPLMPFAALFSGFLLYKIFHNRNFPHAIRALPLVYIAFGLGHTGWTVYQRYAGDTHYLFDSWVKENIPPPFIGDGPFPARRASFSANCPEGYEFVPVYKKPEYLALFYRHYLPAKWLIEDPNHFKDHPQVGPLVIGERKVANFRERDFLFYEDVLFDMRRKFKYDLVKRFDPPKLPLDMQGQTVLIYRNVEKRKNKKKPLKKP